jgi:bacterioferritin-associated ferredoxin
VAVVCLCTGTSERKVRRAIERGATTVDAIGEACGAGTCCGGCHDTLRSLLDESAAAVAGPPPATCLLPAGGQLWARIRSAANAPTPTTTSPT